MTTYNNLFNNAWNSIRKTRWEGGEAWECHVSKFNCKKNSGKNSPNPPPATVVKTYTATTGITGRSVRSNSRIAHFPNKMRPSKSHKTLCYFKTSCSNRWREPTNIFSNHLWEQITNVQLLNSAINCLLLHAVAQKVAWCSVISYLIIKRHDSIDEKCFLRKFICKSCFSPKTPMRLYLR